MRLIEYTPHTIANSLNGRIPIAETIIPLDGRGYRSWKETSDDGILANIRLLMDARGISLKSDLRKADDGLYLEMTKRARIRPAIIKGAGFATKNRDWESLADDELVARVQAFMEERGISGKRELAVADRQLYWALFKREKARPGIMGKIGFEAMHRSWGLLGDAEFIARVQTIMKGLGITGRRELSRADPGTYDALLKRERVSPGIMGRIGFDKKRRDWRSLSDNELATHVQAFMKERGLCRRAELEKADLGLYHALRKRERKSPGIMERVFSDTEASRHAYAVNGVLDALDSFGDGK
ncbi:MAG: hypothetical protein V1861_06465 [Candidatus Micrarchaeota archaeon]